MAAARGHFEVFDQERGISTDPDEIDGSKPWPREYRWRFVDEDGKVRARSDEGFDSAGEAKRDAGDFVIAIRTSTYGLRFPESIADGVREVDQ